jgi:hypothetical protein
MVFVFQEAAFASSKQSAQLRTVVMDQAKLLGGIADFNESNPQYTVGRKIYDMAADFINKKGMEIKRGEVSFKQKDFDAFKKSVETTIGKERVPSVEKREIRRIFNDIIDDAIIGPRNKKAVSKMAEQGEVTSEFFQKA